MHVRARWRSVGALLLVASSPGALGAQGPDPDYFLNPATELAWARASIAVSEQSGFALRFLPVVVTPTRAPLGSNGYANEIDVDAPLAFAGSGRSTGDHDAYASAAGVVDVRGKAVLLCYDCGGGATRDDIAGDASEIIAAAAERGAAAVVLFSVREEWPFLTVPDERWKGRELPVITVSRAGADAILATGHGSPRVSAITDAAEMPSARELHARLRLKVDSGFAAVSTEHFAFRFSRDDFTEQSVRRAATVHERALETIRAALEPEPTDARPWPPSTVVYFGGYDRKAFYTHHWGWGLSNAAGSFLVWDGAEPAIGAIVHEHTHDFTSRFWGRSSSFLEEGIASHVEALATRAGKNHEQARAFLDRGELPRLAELVEIDIGSDPLTPVAYPAAGSFVGYLIETRGLASFRALFEAENRPAQERAAVASWRLVLGVFLDETDAEWRAWLLGR